MTDRIKEISATIKNLFVKGKLFAETPTSQKTDYRRRRIVFVTEHQVLALMMGESKVQNTIRLCKPNGIPKSAKVVGVWHDYNRNAFSFVLEDESFSPVPDCETIPSIEVGFEYFEVKLSGKL